GRIMSSPALREEFARSRIRHAKADVSEMLLHERRRSARRFIARFARLTERRRDDNVPPVFLAALDEVVAHEAGDGFQDWKKDVLNLFYGAADRAFVRGIAADRCVHGYLERERIDFKSTMGKMDCGAPC